MATIVIIKELKLYHNLFAEFAVFPVFSYLIFFFLFWNLNSFTGFSLISQLLKFWIKVEVIAKFQPIIFFSKLNCKDWGTSQYKIIIFSNLPTPHRSCLRQKFLLIIIFSHSYKLKFCFLPFHLSFEDISEPQLQQNLKLLPNSTDSYFYVFIPCSVAVAHVTDTLLLMFLIKVS